MQQEIDAIIKMKTSKEERIKKLCSFFEANNVRVFADLDDTITSPRTQFLSKLMYLTRYKQNNKKGVLKTLMKEFEPNSSFEEIVKNYNFDKIFIISRNDHDLVKHFIQEKRDYFTNLGIDLIGGLGSVFAGNNWVLRSIDKSKMMPKGSVFISDMFEYPVFKKYPNFLNVNKRSGFLSRFFGYSMKLYYFILFVIRN